MNIGFNYQKEIAEQSEKDWFFGSGDKLTGLADKVGGIVTALHAYGDISGGVYQRTTESINHAIDMISELCKKYLPDGTVQRGRQDWMNCASNAPNNNIEIQCNYALEQGLFSDNLVSWFKKTGYINPTNGKIEIADAYISIGSGTTRQGNSVKAPCEFMRVKKSGIGGIIPKSMLPDNKNMSWPQYHDPNRITQEMWNLGKESMKRIPINYEKVNRANFSQLLGGLEWDIFDSYKDQVDGDFIKRLAKDYILLHYGYRLVINDNNIVDPNPKKKILVDSKLLKKEYKFGFYRETDPNAKDHLRRELFVALNAWIGSKEWADNNRALHFLNSTGLIKLFEKNSFLGKRYKGRT